MHFLNNIRTQIKEKIHTKIWMSVNLYLYTHTQNSSYMHKHILRFKCVHLKLRRKKKLNKKNSKSRTDYRLESSLNQTKF